MTRIGADIYEKIGETLDSLGFVKGSEMSLPDFKKAQTALNDMFQAELNISNNSLREKKFYSVFFGHDGCSLDNPEDGDEKVVVCNNGIWLEQFKASSGTWEFVQYLREEEEN
jgi:hypothetical protein